MALQELFTGDIPSLTWKCWALNSGPSAPNADALPLSGGPGELILVRVPKIAQTFAFHQALIQKQLIVMGLTVCLLYIYMYVCVLMLSFLFEPPFRKMVVLAPANRTLLLLCNWVSIHFFPLSPFSIVQ